MKLGKRWWMRPDTAWSIELSQTQAVPEWGGQQVSFRTEDDAFCDGRSVRYVDGRRTRLHLIRTSETAP